MRLSSRLHAHRTSRKRFDDAEIDCLFPLSHWLVHTLILWMHPLIKFGYSKFALHYYTQVVGISSMQLHDWWPQGIGEKRNQKTRDILIRLIHPSAIESSHGYSWSDGNHLPFPSSPCHVQKSAITVVGSSSVISDASCHVPMHIDVYGSFQEQKRQM